MSAEVVTLSLTTTKVENNFNAKALNEKKVLDDTQVIPVTNWPEA